MPLRPVAFRRAISAGGDSLVSSQASVVFDLLGLHDESAQAYRKSGNVWWSALYEGNIDADRESVRSLVKTYPESLYVYRELAFIEYHSGNYEMAVEAFRRGYTCADTWQIFYYCVWHAEAAKRTGAMDQYSTAVQGLRDALLKAKMQSQNTKRLQSLDAMLLTLEGDIDKALDLLNQAVDAGYLAWGLRNGVIFEELRNHPEYIALKAKTDMLVQKHLGRLAELEGSEQAL